MLPHPEADEEIETIIESLDKLRQSEKNEDNSEHFGAIIGVAITIIVLVILTMAVVQ